MKRPRYVATFFPDAFWAVNEPSVSVKVHLPETVLHKALRAVAVRNHSVAVVAVPVCDGRETSQLVIGTPASASGRAMVCPAPSVTVRPASAATRAVAPVSP